MVNLNRIASTNSPKVMLCAYCHACFSINVNDKRTLNGRCSFVTSLWCQKTSPLACPAFHYKAHIHAGKVNGFLLYRPARGGRSCEHFGGYKTINRIPLYSNGYLVTYPFFSSSKIWIIKMKLMILVISSWYYPNEIFDMNNMCL